MQFLVEKGFINKRELTENRKAKHGAVWRG